MPVSRREIMKATVGAGALATVAHFGGVAKAATAPCFRAIVGINLQGGHDGWNMAVPADDRYAAYASGRGAALALPRQALVPLAGTEMALHPSLAPLQSVWAEGALNVVLNIGPLLQPLTKALYQTRPDLRPRNVMLHAEAENHWTHDLTGGAALQIGDAAGSALRVDGYFRDAATGTPLTSAIARQLHEVARAIETRDRPGRMAFSVSQYGYDTHADQVAADDPTSGRQADLYAELATALASFHAAMKGLGLGDNVTTFTLSEFGRAYRGNDQRGTDHAWGNNHLVMGGALTPRTVHGAYPDPTLGGPDDVVGDGRWLPSLAVEDYLGPIARWYGMGAADMAALFPNGSAWAKRTPVGLFA